MHTILKTDQYKFAMAEAGHPWQTETFYYSHRKNGPHFMPLDVREYVKNIFKNWKIDPQLARQTILKVSGLNLGDWFNRAASLEDPYSLLKIESVPKNSWFLDKAPAFKITGPSFLVSWLEPQILQLHYRIQIATLALRDPDKLQQLKEITCEQELDIIRETLDNLADLPNLSIQTDCYISAILDRATKLVDAVGEESASRIFEVGYRAASCLKQHEAALVACCKAGIQATSNTYAAQLLNLKSVGTMGHEHVQRCGSDRMAYRSMAERLSGPTFCLLDTFDSIKSGIPEAIKLMKDEPDRQHAMRFDSGDIEKQFRVAAEAYPAGRFCLEDGWNLEKTQKFEKIRKELNLKPKQVLYGYGGYLVSPPWFTLSRDRVAAVWKVAESNGSPVMKLSTAGKTSLPGNMNLWYHPDNCNMMVTQEGEPPPRGWVNAYSGPPQKQPNTNASLELSKDTQNIIRSYRDIVF